MKNIILNQYKERLSPEVEEEKITISFKDKIMKFLSGILTKEGKVK